MNLKNFKKLKRIDKKIVFRKIKSKFLNSITDKFYKLRDYNISTYSYDYSSYFTIDLNIQIDLFEIFNIEIETTILKEFVDYCISHEFKILSDKYVSVNTESSFEDLQKNFNKKLIPFSSKCYNKISSNYNLIDWQSDFNANKQWQFEWFKNITYGNSSGSDIKIPWELGRLQHLPSLAHLYNINRNELTRLEIRNQIFDFMASNPPNYGVQWMTSMDIGIRLVNIIFTIIVSSKTKILFENDELELINSYLFDHYLHIRENIEYSDGIRGNHYLSNLCSILIYICFIEDTSGKSLLLDKYIKLINKELDYQFNSDGSNFEASTRYHIFTSQMLISVDLILQKLTNKKLNQNRMNSINSFALELLKFTPPPQIGDNDSGFYWKVSNKEEVTYKSILNTIETNYRLKNKDNYLEFGYIHRKIDKIDIMFKCGKVGQNGKGGHDHNDNLSYIIYLNNLPFVVDIGTFCYTSDFSKRNYYRSSLQHNVLTINQTEQNDISQTLNDDMFWLDETKSNPTIINKDDNIFSGKINYFGKEYKRDIKINSNEIIVTDYHKSKICKNVRIHFHPNVKIESVEKDVYKVWINENSMILLIVDEESVIENYMYSPNYGVEIQSKRITISSKKNKIVHKFKMLP